MEISLVLKLIPVIMSTVEVLKRFIPDKHRTYANPILAVVVGLSGAYYAGGLTEVTEVLMSGVTAAVGAIGAYKIPKVVGSELGIK